MNATQTLVGEVNGLIGGMSSRVHTFFCGLGGHELLLNVEPTRLSLKCSSCPYETAGWTVKGRPYDGRSIFRAHALVPHTIHG